jgi:glycosyltransferase involved in cell wall biosynthesis
MKIAQLNTYDIQGGAARAAYRLHKGLLLLGQDSILLSKYRVSNDPSVKQIRPVSQPDPVPQLSLATIQSQYINANRTPLSNTLFSLPYPGVDLSQLQPVTEAEVINLHWVADFQSPTTLKKLFELGKPVVWTLHDMWAFTGGCHYSAGCDRYQQDCHACPQLIDDPFDLAAVLLKDKLECFAGANLTIVAPSRWLADCAKQSQLFRSHRVEVIPYSLETHDLFTPIAKSTAKQILDISPETTTLLFGAGTATEARKGFAELVQATRHCLENPQFRQLAAEGRVEILCFGYPSELLSQLEVPVRSLGAIESDHQLRQIYSAADLFILPSLEDNLPNTMMEALSCGTPVIGFAVGGIPDLVEDGVTGRTVPLQDTEQLAAAILDCMFDPALRQHMGETGRQRMAEHHAMPIQAESYLALYQELLAQPSTQIPSHPLSVQFKSLNGGSTVPGGSSGADLNSAAIETAAGDSFAQVSETIALKAALAKLQQTQTSQEQLKSDFEQVQLQFRQSQAALDQSGAELDHLRQEAAQFRAAAASEQQAANQLRNQLQRSEIVRARLIQELRQSNHHLHHMLQESQQRVQELERSTKKLRTEIRELNQQHDDLRRSAEHLDRELQYLSTTKAAIRKLMKTTLRKLKLYDFVYENNGVFVRIYNLFMRDKWQPATLANPILSPSPTSEQITEAVPNASGQTASGQTAQIKQVEPANARTEPLLIDMEARLVEAIVLFRTLGLEIETDLDLEQVSWLADAIDSIRAILCIQPEAAVIPLLQPLAKQGAQVVCVNCQPKDEAALRNCGFEVTAQNLGTWMIKSGQTSLHHYDAVYINPETTEDLRLLQGRLAAKTKIISRIGKSLSELKAGLAETELGTFAFYDQPPALWVDPLYSSKPVEQHLQWPWNYAVPQLPATLPSGKPLPKISVVTVTYNQGAYIEETIRSILLQGYPNLEYIVIDGGSTDNTVEILKRYQDSITYWVSEPDQGQSNALNKGFARATGDILAWLNSDDCYLPGTLYRVALMFDIYGADMVAGGCELRIDRNPVPFKTHHNAMPVGEVVPLPVERILNIDECWQSGEFFYQPEVFWTRDLWQRSGAHVREDLFYSMDYELWLRMAAHKATIIHIPDALTRFRMHENQKTHGENIPYLPELKQVAEKFKQEVEYAKSEKSAE